MVAALSWSVGVRFASREPFDFIGRDDQFECGNIDPDKSVRPAALFGSFGGRVLRLQIGASIESGISQELCGCRGRASAGRASERSSSG
jgi:hypothetical protein